ncbi:MAG: hypothetical protein ACK4IS_05325 [Erythrobacter sp.]
MNMMQMMARLGLVAAAVTMPAGAMVQQVGDRVLSPWRGSRIACPWAVDGRRYDAVIVSLPDSGYNMRIRYDQDGSLEDTTTGSCRTR